MTIRVVFPAAPEMKLSNSRNVFLIGGSGSAAAARTAAEKMAGVDPGEMAAWSVVDLVDSADHSFVADINGPVGRSGSPWALLTAGGDPLPAA